MILCMPAREVYRKKACDIPSSVERHPEEFQKLFDGLPDGSRERIEVDRMISAQDGKEKAAEADIDESVKQLRHILSNRPENTLAVVAHGGLITRLTGEEADNCMMLECILFHNK